MFINWLKVLIRQVEKLSVSLDKSSDLKKFTTRAQVLLASVVVLSYTVVTVAFFIDGLVQANYHSLMRVANQYAKQYDVNPNTPLPRTNESRGYIGWSNIPKLEKNGLNKPVNIHKTSVQLARFIDGKKSNLWWPDKVTFMFVKPLANGKTLYLLREIDIKQNSVVIRNHIRLTITSVIPIALIISIVLFIITNTIVKKLLALIQSLGDWAEPRTH